MAKKTDNKKGTETIFEGGPTFDQIENWKKEFGDVYRIDFDEQPFIFRTISRFEYKQMVNEVEGNQSNQTTWFREEQICQKAVLFPEGYGRDEMTEGKAGIPTVVSEYVLSKSGFNSDAGPQKL